MSFVIQFLGSFLKFKSLSIAILGWIIMMVLTPYLALILSSQIPSLITGIIVVSSFFMGAFIIGQGLKEFEELDLSNQKTVNINK